MRVSLVLLLVAACGYPQPTRTADAAAGSDAVRDASGIDTPTPTDSPSGMRNVAATWKIGPVGGNPTGCPAGYDTVALYSQQIDPNTGQPIGTQIVDLFSCTATSGTSSPLQPGKYQETIAVTNQTTQTTYAKSVSKTLDLTTSSQTYTTQIYTDGGYFQVAWSLVGATSGMPLTCTQAGATSIEVLATNTTDPTKVYDDLFTCTDGQGITTGAVSGVYTLSISANNAQMQAVGNLTLSNQQMGTANSVVNVGNVTITIQNK